MDLFPILIIYAAGLWLGVHGQGRDARNFGRYAATSASFVLLTSWEAW